MFKVNVYTEMVNQRKRDTTIVQCGGWNLCVATLKVGILVAIIKSSELFKSTLG